MKKIIVGMIAAVLLSGAVVATTASAGGDDDRNVFRARLSGYQEVPTVSTRAHGTFSAVLTGRGLEYRLEYDNMEGTVLAAHIHLGAVHTAGGVISFLCGGDGSPACPSGPDGVVRGVLTEDDVIGPEVQGIAPGEADEAVRALFAGVTYVNVHSNKFPGGEIRGQIRRAGD